jgi:transcription initiation factor TFIIB
MSRVYTQTFDEQSGNQLPNETTCPECDGRVRVDGGERTCEDCGLVVEERRIDHGAEWRSFDDDTESKSRVGAPRTTTRHDRGLSTTIGYKRDGGDSQFSAAKQRRLHRQRREHSRAQFDSKQERNEMYGLAEIRRLHGALDIPKSMWERACELFRAAQRKGLFVGRSLDAFTAGALYAVCRCAGLPRQIEAFEEHARCPLQKIRNAYQVLNLELNLEAQFRTPSDFIPKLASEEELAPEARQLARRLVDTVESKGITGGRPSGLAAACVYIASQVADPEPVTQQALAKAAYVSDNTVRSRRDDIREEVDIEGLRG